MCERRRRDQRKSEVGELGEDKGTKNDTDGIGLSIVRTR